MPERPTDRLGQHTNAELEQALLEVGERRAQAAAERSAASAELRPLVRQAAERGMSVAAIARAAKLSRPAVYDFLER